MELEIEFDFRKMPFSIFSNTQLVRHADQQKVNFTLIRGPKARTGIYSPERQCTTSFWDSDLDHNTTSASEQRRMRGEE